VAYKKKTLRRMHPTTRRYARILNDLDSVLRRLRNLTEDIDRLEADSRALHNRQTWEKVSTTHVTHDPQTGDNQVQEDIPGLDP
jgi:hypothetical protein